MSKVIEVNHENFDQLINSTGVTVMKFGAPWCGPCKMFAPVLENLASSMDGIVIGDVNIDENSELAERFHIMSVPTTLIFKDGSLAKQSLGFLPEEKLKNLISKYL